MSIRKIQGPGIWLEIDHDDAATPALVCCKVRHETLTSTYDCALGSGFIDDRVELSRAAIRWLESLSDTVEAAYTIARKDAPEYN